ncbi:MAG: TIR domain-containing protein [Catenulispora sp.]|nr:TIR domain-containing protein [Catenulispora sp.]
MPNIFINYRYTDKAFASALYDALEGTFSDISIFAALESVEPGQRYGEKIEDALKRADVFFAIVGLDWFTLKDDDGVRLLDKRSDWVRREILQAFSQNIPVVPILLTGAAFPEERDLPKRLREFAKLHYLELNPVTGQGFANLARHLSNRFPYALAEPAPYDWRRAATAHGVVGADGAVAPSADDPSLRRRVFVIYGRDSKVRQEMFSFLRDLDLNPQEWEPLVNGTGSTAPFLLEVVTGGLSLGRAQAVIALMTPDDIVELHPKLRDKREAPYETTRTMQPRPNVLIELGIALGTYRDSTIIVEVGDLRPIADIAGLNVIRFDGSAGAVGKIVERLKAAGCAVNDTGSDWRRPGRFSRWDAYKRKAADI